MTRWSIGRNNYYFTGCVFLEDAPWYIFTIEYIIQTICDWFPPIPLPKFIKITRDNEKYTLREWCGTTQELFHIYVCSEVFQWCYSKINSRIIEFPYNMLKEQFPEHFEDEFETEIINREIEEHKEYSSSIEKEFKAVYDKLLHIYQYHKNRTENKEGN
jgi:hypothetical protein